MQRVIGSEWRRLGRGSHGYKSCFWVETGWKGSKTEAERPERERWSQREKTAPSSGWGSSGRGGKTLFDSISCGGEAKATC